MIQSECQVQVGRLIAAFPSSKATDATAREYVGSLAKLRYSEALRDSVDALIATERWLPTIAQVREEYDRHRDKYLPLALPEPDVTPEQQQKNLAWTRSMTAHLSAKGREGHTLTFDDCEHPGCVAVRDG